MQVTVTAKDGSIAIWETKAHCAIDKFVSALKENMSEWQSIKIEIANDE